MENIIKQKSLALITALEKEKSRLPEYSAFGGKNNLTDYDAAISFLQTGIKPKNYENNDLLVAIIDDFDTICNDYEIQ